jgi:hypothetical protein
MNAVGKVLLVVAATLALLGGALLLMSKLGLGRLPGDIVYRRGKLTLYAPVGLMIVASVVLTVVLNVIAKR